VASAFSFDIRATLTLSLAQGSARLEPAFGWQLIDGLLAALDNARAAYASLSQPAKKIYGETRFSSRIVVASSTEKMFTRETISNCQLNAFPGGVVDVEHACIENCGCGSVGQHDRCLSGVEIDRSEVIVRESGRSRLGMPYLSRR
jgi:hypothetical protein